MTEPMESTLDTLEMKQFNDSNLGKDGDILFVEIVNHPPVICDVHYVPEIENEISFRRRI